MWGLSALPLTHPVWDVQKKAGYTVRRKQIEFHWMFLFKYQYNFMESGKNSPMLLFFPLKANFAGNPGNFGKKKKCKKNGKLNFDKISSNPTNENQ